MERAGPSGVVTVSAPGATNPQQVVNVTVGSVTLFTPFGSFDTPSNNASGISGAIPVTGWALDNIEVSNVGIWREAVGSEPTTANGLVYIGDAVLVSGARPDVEGAFPNVPFNYRGGRGYQLLTNFLPGSGSGTYKLHAIAVNKAGAQTDLGTKTIIVDNAHAPRPFGTIDTPSQGGGFWECISQLWLGADSESVLHTTRWFDAYGVRGWSALRPSSL